MSTNKRERLAEELKLGVVMIHVDTRVQGVCVPEEWRGLAHVKLNLSHDFFPPDLLLEEWGVTSTLTFAGVPFVVFVPWCAIFAYTCEAADSVWIWHGDLPSGQISTPKRPSYLRLVKS